MNTANIKELHLQELSVNEIENIEGGGMAIFFAGMIIGACLYCYTHY